MKPELQPFFELASLLHADTGLSRLEEPLQKTLEELNIHLPYMDFAPLNALSGSADKEQKPNGEQQEKSVARPMPGFSARPTGQQQKPATPDISGQPTGKTNTANTARPDSNERATTQPPAFSFRGRVPSAAGTGEERQSRSLKEETVLPRNAQSMAAPSGKEKKIVPPSSAQAPVQTARNQDRAISAGSPDSQKEGSLADASQRAARSSEQNEPAESGIAGIQQIMEELGKQVALEPATGQGIKTAEQAPPAASGLQSRTLFKTMPVRATSLSTPKTASSTEYPTTMDASVAMKPVVQAIGTLADSIMHKIAPTEARQSMSPTEHVSPRPFLNETGSNSIPVGRANDSSEARIESGAPALTQAASTTGAVQNHTGTTTFCTPAAMSAEDLAALVNDALVRQARRNGIDI